MGTFYETRSEGWGAVGITGPTTQLWYPIYSVLVLCVPGDLLQMVGEIELRNDATYNVEVICAFFGQPGAALGSVMTDESKHISPLNGSDTSPQMHYASPHHAFFFRSPAGCTSYGIAYTARARSTSGTGAQNMTVMPGQGFLQVLNLGQ